MRYTVPAHIEMKLHSIRNEADNLLEEFNCNFACSPGCCGCCHTFLWHLVEIISVREKHEYRDVLSALERRIDFYNAQYHFRKSLMGNASEDHNVFESFFKDLDCLFLNENKCLIYEYRPIICRLYASMDGENCSGLHELPAEYPARANIIRDEVFLLNSKFTQLFHADCTIQGLPFRYLLSAEA